MRDSWFSFEKQLNQYKCTSKLSCPVPSETAGISSIGRLSPVVSSLVMLGKENGEQERERLRLGSSIYTGSKPKLKLKLINNQVSIPLFHLPLVYESPHKYCLDNLDSTQLISLSVKTQKGQ